MATYYIGQRVRIVADYDDEYGGALIGSEGVVNGKFDRYPCWSDLHGPFFIDGYSVMINGREYICHPEELEPIQPEGMKPAEWSDCLWQPESEEVTT